MIGGWTKWADKPEFEVLEGSTVTFRKVGRWMRVTRRVDGLIAAKETYRYINALGADQEISILVASHEDGVQAFDIACDRLVTKSLLEYRKENGLWLRVIASRLRDIRVSVLKFILIRWG